MNLLLRRVERWPGSTIGELSVDKQFVCYTVEDVVRPNNVKVPGATAIPAGRYRVIVTHSPRFGVPLPLLLDVPGYSGVRIHPGNTAADTEGCILPGLEMWEGGVRKSRAAFAALFSGIRAALESGEEVWIDIDESWKT